jgi:ABC-type Mn2+/Zn2+ transport system ATPase subunit
MAEKPLISMIEVDFGYRKTVIVEKANWDIFSGRFVGLIGPNGAGKTTILRTLLGLMPPIAGQLEIQKALAIGYVPQRGQLDPLFPLTVYELVLMGRFPKLKRWGWWRRNADGPTISALERCGIAPLLDKPFRELSGGQKQRCLIARALVSDPDLLILDEPTNNMDLQGEHEIMSLLNSLHRMGKTILMVSHRLDVLVNSVTDLAVIHNGMVSHGSVETMLKDDLLSKLFGLPLHVLKVQNCHFVSTAGHKHD